MQLLLESWNSLKIDEACRFKALSNKRSRRKRELPFFRKNFCFS